MLGRDGAAAKRASKFEDSDCGSRMSRPSRAMSELPHRLAPRVLTRPRTVATLGVGTEAGGGGVRHRGVAAGRGTSPRSPLHEKKPAGAGGGAGPRAAELEAKLGKAHDQLMAMREQLAAAEKARNDARGVFADAKKRHAVIRPVKKREANNALQAQEHTQRAEVVTSSDVVNGASDGEEIRGMVDSMNNEFPIAEEAQKTSDNGREVSSYNIAVVLDDGDGNKGNPYADQLWSKLAAKDREVYELRAKLMLKDIEVDELRAELATKDTNIGTLTAELVARETEFAALRLRADNAELTKTASDADRKTTAAKARELERALMEGAAREARLAERLTESERAREALEAEARRSRVQSEQWRKAAEEAAAVLGGADHHAGARGTEETDQDGQDAGDGVSGGKRKPGGAVRLLADLWKKRASR